MNRYYIESVRYGEGESGFACGPIGGAIVAEAKIKTNAGEAFYLSLADVCGIPNFYKTPESTFEKQLTLDEDVVDVLTRHFIDTGDYEEIFRKKDPEWFQLYRYLIFFVCATEYECEKFESTSVGKYIDEFEIPVSDVEEEYCGML